MDLRHEYDTHSGDHIQIFSGMIERDELQTGDELYMQIGRFLLVGKVDADAMPMLELRLVDEKTLELGKHPITAKRMDGRWDQESLDEPVPHNRKPLVFDRRFVDRMQKQGVDTDRVPYRQLALGHMRRDYPFVLRRSKV